MKRIYFDHAAATPVDPRVVKAMEPFLSHDFANPGAIHKEGVLAHKHIEDARATIAAQLGVHADEIVFTGSATESCNLALVGAVSSWRETHPNRVPHIIVSAIEHGAVLEPTRVLEQMGVRITRLSVDASGIVDPTALKSMLNEDTVLVSVMYANNEIGTVEPIKEIAKIIRKWKKEVRGVIRTGKPKNDERYPLFHTDATQAVNYLDMHIPRLGVDMLTMNAAKIYGPKGIGLLVALRGTSIEPIIVGGGHERGRRAGTENVPGIIGFAVALHIAQAMAASESTRLTSIRDYMMSELKNTPGLVINGSIAERLPNNIHFSLPNIEHEFLALELDAQGFAVATKSACNETDAETSHVLQALRAADNTQGPTSGIRLSFGRSTTQKDIDTFLVALRHVIMRE